MKEVPLSGSDGHDIACYAWENQEAKALIQIAHGMGEHARRYDAVAQQLVAAGFSVFANDHRGHGRTADAVPGYMGPDGWNRNLADLYEINQHLRAENPGKPLILLGHSMGSMLSQQYITRYGHSIDALVLSGSPGFKETTFAFVTRWIMKFEHWRLGSDGNSELMQNTIFGDANKPFDKPGATGFEWLSRDDAEVQKYVEDPECGFVLTVGSLIDMFAGSAVSLDPLAIDKVPAALPLYIFSGSEDPVHGDQQDIDRMVAAYRRRGLNDLTYKLYPGGRHEMFNETNRQEVIDDLITWLNSKVAAEET